MEFVATPGTAPSFEGCRLILPAVTVANVGQLTVDLLVSTLALEPVGVIEDECVLPCVGNDPYTTSVRPPRALTRKPPSRPACLEPPRGHAALRAAGRAGNGGDGCGDGGVHVGGPQDGCSPAEGPGGGGAAKGARRGPGAVGGGVRVLGGGGAGGGGRHGAPRPAAPAAARAERVPVPLPQLGGGRGRPEGLGHGMERAGGGGRRERAVRGAAGGPVAPLLPP
mmetsp:Transcript_16729/g.52705  ORF Transcript_16729/g.52705 Transcript_16729/m.52705 type:complete len:224 (+) Transcript_16729:3523-4194(+)